MRTRLLYIITGLIVVIVVLHYAALSYSLYWHFWWYDLIVHFFGGIFAGVLVAWILFFSGYLEKISITTKSLFLASVVGAIVIGVGWEVFERLIGHTWSPEGYWLDTGIDIVMDILGGILGFLLISKYYKRDISEDEALV